MTTRGRALVATALAALLTACAGAPAATTAPADPTSRSAPSETAQRPTATECAARIVDKMTMAERVGQLVMVGVTSGSASETAVLRKLHIGSVILMGNHSDGTSGVRRLTKKLQISGLPTPLLISVDQEGGLVQRLKGAGFDTIPSAKVQSKWSNAKLTSRATRWGRQLASAGVHWTLAPVTDTVPTSVGTKNAPIGALGRGYGSDPDVVGKKVSAFVKGMDAAGIATSTKHFPGIGRVIGNTDFTSGVKDTTTRPDDPYLEPFAAAVKAGASSVMVSTVTYTKIDSHHVAAFSSTVIGLIRGRLGFDGVVISDDLGAAKSMASVPAKQRGADFIKAGGDVAMTVAPSLADEFVAGIRSAAKDSAVAAQVREAAVRVVTMKIDQGLVPCR